MTGITECLPLGKFLALFPTAANNLHPYLAGNEHSPVITCAGLVVSDIIIPVCGNSPFPPPKAPLVWQGDKEFRVHQKEVIYDYLDALPPRLRAQVQVRYGGVAFAAARMLNQLGARVKFIGAMGDDAFGKGLHDLMRREGMDTSGVRVLEGMPSAANLIFTNLDTGATAFNMLKESSNRALTSKDVLRAGLDGTALFFGGTALTPGVMDGLEEVIDAAERLKMKMVWDTVVDKLGLDKRFFGEGGASAIDIVTASIQEAQAISGCTQRDDIIEFFLERNPALFLKLGADGCDVATTKKSIFGEAARFHMPGIAGVTVVDGTGAGDDFSGYVTYAAALGLSPIETAIGATVCGAITVEQVGGGSLGTDHRLEFFRKLTQLKWELLLQSEDAAIRQEAMLRLKKEMPDVYTQFRRAFDSKAPLECSELSKISKAIGENAVK